MLEADFGVDGKEAYERNEAKNGYLSLLVHQKQHILLSEHHKWKERQ